MAELSGLSDQGWAEPREAVNKQPRNLDGGQIRDVNRRAGIQLWPAGCSKHPGDCGDSDSAAMWNTVIYMHRFNYRSLSAFVFPGRVVVVRSQ